MTGGATRGELWRAVHAERAALADHLADLRDDEWARPSLCGDWTVEEAVAHLTAGASIGIVRWLISMAGARFDDGVHNRRRLDEHRGATPAETLRNFRAVVTSTTAPTNDVAAWLGEVVVHGQDVMRPLGRAHAPAIEAVTEVARFYAGRDFTVDSRTLAKGLRWEASDGPFAGGAGPLVTGSTLALTMAMAGRAVFCDDLTGPGVPILRERCR
ncbi:maleylpyruvate isomerase family mycothiol-dependent enzyme [Catenuloplanes atrovinosus]|uniref:Uncharacterized protein (TIGR03083 family) n=1 Tax=Catenuloplanes atrovinosus TaxID=137266 RepID=A0AAE4CA81_9ACTN|nr:maleylpyruvate isomerase family mycothiol-dependent enzyme [Catenuloplanes atrovinosus]MDR7277346.1 uncharacterized protein (TIGR03083 family) [Catenuloplanes atrovinosus]